MNTTNTASDGVGPEHQREHAQNIDREQDAPTLTDPSVVETPSGHRVTTLLDAGAGAWNLACPNCGTYQGCIKLTTGAVRGFERPCDTCKGLLFAETTAVWPVAAGRDVPKERLREAVCWSAFAAAPTEQTSQIDPDEPGQAAREVLLPPPNHRWIWFRRPTLTVTVEPATLGVAGGDAEVRE